MNKSQGKEPVLVIRACNTRIWEAEAGSNPGLHNEALTQKKKKCQGKIINLNENLRNQ
jgi:hypothetical protein